MLPRGEIARYLGYQGAALEPPVEALAARCEQALFSQCRPRRGARKVLISELPFLGDSADLRRHLQDCTAAFLFALTLGGEADRLLRQWSVENMAKAAVGQACAAAWMDTLCDEYIDELEEALPEGAHFAPPFSPGYGDFSLRWQPEVLRLLEARRLGISLSAAGMLLPQKSMTAVLGIGPHGGANCRTGCAACKKADCAFRKGV